MDVEGEKVALRTDLNLPIDDGRPQKTVRFHRYLETIRELSEDGAKLVVLAHQGRPGREDFKTLESHAELIESEIGEDVRFISSILGEDLQKTLEEMEEGDIALLENLRLMSEELKSYPAEKHSEDLYINDIAEKFDFYINDAFSAAHRSQASLVGLPELLESSAGPIMEQELKSCRKIRDEFDSGVLILGGEKPSDLLGIMEQKIDSVDKILLGGVPGELALMIEGYDLGDKEEWITERGLDREKERLSELMDTYPNKFELPTDLSDGEKSRDLEEFEGMSWDIGENTAEKYAEIIEEADSALMKGPMGVFEKHSHGTEKILEALKKCEGFTVMGGGHTSSLVEEFGHSMDDFDHVSIAGGAFVRCVSGGELPAVKALDI